MQLFKGVQCALGSTLNVRNFTSEIKECTANAANRSHRQFLFGIGFVCMVKLGGVRFKRLYHYNTATEMLIGWTDKCG